MTECVLACCLIAFVFVYFVIYFLRVVCFSCLVWLVLACLLLVACLVGACFGLVPLFHDSHVSGTRLPRARIWKRLSEPRPFLEPSKVLRWFPWTPVTRNLNKASPLLSGDFKG